MVPKIKRKNMFQKLSSGEHFGAYCLTEPTAGSDANSEKLRQFYQMMEKTT